MPIEPISGTIPFVFGVTAADLSGDGELVGSSVLAFGIATANLTQSSNISGSISFAFKVAGFMIGDADDMLRYTPTTDSTGTLEGGYIDKFGLALIGDKSWEIDAVGLPAIPYAYKAPTLENWQEEARLALINSSIDPNFIGARIVHLWQILQHSTLKDRWSQLRQTLPLNDDSNLYLTGRVRRIVEIAPPANSTAQVGLLGEFSRLGNGRRLAWTLRVTISATGVGTLLDIDLGNYTGFDYTGSPAQKINLFDTEQTFAPMNSTTPAHYYGGVWEVYLQRPYSGNVATLAILLRNAPESTYIIFNQRIELYDIFKNSKDPVEIVAAYLVAYLESSYD